MKVLVLSHISELLGGAERSMLDIFNNWSTKHKIEPEFILREPLKSLAPELKKRGWKCYPVRFTFWSDGKPPVTDEDIYYNALQNSRATKKIEQIIKQTKPDLVMTNSIVSPWAALAAYSQNVSHVWFVREYGDLDHGRVFEIGREKTMEDIGSLSALVVTNSKTLAQHVARYIDKKKVTTLYNPFNLDEIGRLANKTIKSPFKNKNNLKLIITSNIARTKGQLEAVEAVAKLNHQGHGTELCLVGSSGDAEFSRQLEDTIARHEIQDKVHLVGYQREPLPFVAHADIGIMPSRMEAFGRTTFEFLALGKPVIGTDSGATPEMVESGVNGYLYQPGDADELAGKIKNYAMNPEYLKKHGEASKRRAVEMMRSDLNIDNLYKKILKATTTKPDVQPSNINYFHRLETILRNPPKSSQASLPAKLRRRAYRLAKASYIRLKRYSIRLVGR